MTAAVAAPAVRERPILFSAPMIRAILSGAKCQTRRIVTTREPLQFLGGRGEEADPSKWGWFFDGPDHHGYMVLGRGHDERHDHGSISIPCPYGEPGDRLWCKETWRTAKCFDDKSPRQVAEMAIGAGYERCWAPAAYVDGSDSGGIRDFGGEWGKTRPSIFMPRWASRITVEIVEIRVQRLQEISEDDARAEGVVPYTPPYGHISPDQRVPGPGFDRCRLGDQPHRLPFADLWDRINGKRRRREYLQVGDPGYTVDRPWRTVIDTSARWEANPWIWAITFRGLP